MLTNLGCRLTKTTLELVTRDSTERYWGKRVSLWAGIFYHTQSEKDSIDLENITSELFMEPSREKAAMKLFFTKKNCIVRSSQPRVKPLFFYFVPLKIQIVGIKLCV